MQGHTIYVLNAGPTTYVCDVESRKWTRWAYQVTDSFPIIYAVRTTTNTSRKTVFALAGADSAIYYMSDALYQDTLVNYTFRIVTESLDFGTLNRKMMARWSLLVDRPSVTSYVQLYWSDDDYQTYTGPRQININSDLPTTHRLGQFRQRSFKLEYVDNYPFRVQRFEVDVNKGIS